ncbi:MAG: hypothetical protein K6C08_00625 [Oscillospiraceae bacterium]|nr:hypothetical protein [Oscillospiraceae bacterium]
MKKSSLLSFDRAICVTGSSMGGERAAARMAGSGSATFAEVNGSVS